LIPKDVVGEFASNGNIILSQLDDLLVSRI